MRFALFPTLINLNVLAVSAQISTLFLFPGQTVDPSLYDVVNCNQTAVSSEPSSSAPSTALAGYLTTTRPFLGSETLASPLTSTIAQPSGTSPGTVEVVIPATYTTLTSFFTGSGPFAPATTFTVADPIGSSPGTVLIVDPVYFTTVSSLITGNDLPTTRTLATPTGTIPGTVQVLFSGAFVTTTQVNTAPATVPTTVTLAQPSGDSPGTVAVLVPGAFATTTFIYSGTGTLAGRVTSTLATPGVSSPGLIGIIEPSNFVTVTLPQTADNAATPITTTLANPIDTSPGTVAVLTPVFNTVTSLQSAGDSATVTTTIALPSGTVPGTVEVLTPGIYTTITQVYTGSGVIAAPLTTTLALPSGTAAGTVQVITPGVYDTLTQVYTGPGTIGSPITTTIVRPSGTLAGTVAVLTPGVYTTLTSLFTGSDVIAGPITTTVASPSGTEIGTVVVLTPGVYNTFTSQYTGPGTIGAPITSTVAAPVGTAPGTVAILTPASYITTTIAYTGVSGGPLPSTSTISAAGTAPGTIEVFVSAVYVTTTISSGSATTTATSTVAQAQGTSPGTIQVIVPTSIFCTTNSVLGSNRGLSYGIWNGTAVNNVPATDETSGFQNYLETSFDSTPAVYVGQTRYIGAISASSTSDQPITIYNDTTRQFSIGYKTIIHRGFLYARTAGVYTFTSPPVDDILLLWTGPNAVSGFTRANANLVHNTATTVSTRTFTATLTQGQYLPIRIQYADGGPPGSFSFSITGPDGTARLGGAGSRTTDIVTGACDGSTPSFPPWTTPQSYNTITSTQTGTAAPGTQTIAQPSGTTPGTVLVTVPTSIFCSVPGQTLSTDGTGNSGVQYAIYNSPVGNNDASNQQTGFSAYPVNAFDSTAALHLGITNKIGITSPGDNDIQPIYADTTQGFPNQYITAIHRGYLYARTTGAYRFVVSYSNDITLIWTGTNAISGFTRNNANLVYVTTANPTTATYTVTLTAGQYLPFRIQFSDGQGAGGLTASITGPTGAVLLDSTKATDIVYQTCSGATSNGVAVPAFPALTQVAPQAAGLSCGLNDSYCQSSVANQQISTGTCPGTGPCLTVAASTAQSLGAASYAIDTAGNTYYYSASAATVASSGSSDVFTCFLAPVISVYLFDSGCVV